MGGINFIERRASMYDPKQVFGQYGCDWQERVNFERLRKERLERLKNSMKACGLEALLLFSGDNVRYATGTFDQIWKRANYLRYALVFADSDPILYETVGDDLECVKRDSPWLKGRIYPAMVWRNSGPAMNFMLGKFVDQIKNALKGEGLGANAKVGIDLVDLNAYNSLTAAGIHVVDGYQAISDARLIKTEGELALLKIACSIADAAFEKARHEWVVPGARESQVYAKINGYCLEQGMEPSPGGIVLASGANTNPYLRTWTDKVIRCGDMVIIDIPNVAYMGYGVDYVRCWPCASSFTKEQKKVYTVCYEMLQNAIKAIKPGNTSADIAAQFREDIDQKEGTVSLLNTAHSMGLSNYEAFLATRAFSSKYPVEIKKNMYLAVETYYAEPGTEGARLEENGVITDKGFQRFTLFPFESEALD